MKIKYMVFALAAAVLSACGSKTETTIPVSTVSVDPASVELQMDQTVQLSVSVLPENASDVKVSWESANPIVAAVNQDGVVTAVSLGQTTVYAKVGDKSGSCQVTVSPKPVETVTVSPESLVLTVGDTETLQVTVLPEDATDRSVVWSSSDESIATVDQNGLVTSLAPGNVTISAESVNGVKGECSLVCKAPFSFSVEYQDANAEWKPVTETIIGYPGQEVALRLAVIEGDGVTFSWNVADPTYAAIADEKLTLKCPGQTILTVEASNGMTVEVHLESRLTGGFLWSGSRCEMGAMIPIGNSAEQIVSVTWNDGQKEVPLPVQAYSILSDSDLILITEVAEGYQIKSLGEQGDAVVNLKVGDYLESELCTVRVSGKWASGNEDLDHEEKFPW